eukprot:8524552-Pyramimonas_sp.AAC.1
MSRTRKTADMTHSKPRAGRGTGNQGQQATASEDRKRPGMRALNGMAPDRQTPKSVGAAARAGASRPRRLWREKTARGLQDEAGRDAV